MKYLSAFVLLTAALAAPAAAQNQRTFYNEKGQTTGTATTSGTVPQREGPDHRDRYHQQQRHHHLPQQPRSDHWHGHQEQVI